MTGWSVKSSKDLAAELLFGKGSFSNTSSSMWESVLGSSWIVSILWWSCFSAAATAGTAVMGCSGWCRLVDCAAGKGLMIRTEAESRLLSISTFCKTQAATPPHLVWDLVFSHFQKEWALSEEHLHLCYSSLKSTASPPEWGAHWLYLCSVATPASGIFLIEFRYKALGWLMALMTRYGALKLRLPSAM